ncbi:type II toxin-antitoxin system HicB family antitoxin [Candidatus Gracilibacteria bacterium]|nr:type II toxin-antitoxin system HicB family antitoxin [Candidatus Gracilibacteria bacterium]
MEYKKDNYNIEFVLLPAKEGGYTVTVPMLPGCITEGDSLEEAKQNAREAIELYITTLKEDGFFIPKLI